MTRDRKLVLLFSSLALVGTGLVGVHVTTAGPRLDTVSSTVQVAPGAPMSVLLVGDTMLADGAQDAIDQHGYSWPLEKVRSLLDADVVVANSEVPISTRSKPADPLKPFSYHSAPAAASALADAGVDVLGLANNHAMDVGPRGLFDTIRSARRAGMTTFGAGRDAAAAERPLLLHSAVGTVAVVAFGEDFGPLSSADVGKPGTAVLGAAAVQRGVDVARAAGADVAVAYVHWGDNYQPVVPEQRLWARQFAAAGYDLVVGTGPHVVQPFRVVGGMPVAYSLGNFAFGSPGRFTSFGAKGYGLTLRLELRPNGGLSVSTTCLATDNAEVDFQARACTAAQADELFPTVSPDLVRTGPSTAQWRCACLRPVRRAGR